LIVYVETNFVLELAYLRTTSDNCQRLLDLAQERRVTIVIASFGFTQNKNDFRVVEDELASYGCKLMFSFDAAEGYVRSKLVS
jgi:hypothetical protein